LRYCLIADFVLICHYLFIFFTSFIMPAIPSLHIGCASWQVPPRFHAGASQLERQPEAERKKSHLQRYSEYFSAVEINSSFYRSHLPKTYARWRIEVPSEFRFSVKLPRLITHQMRLENCEDALQRFLDEVAYLQEKLGCILIQLPPSLKFDKRIVAHALEIIRNRTDVSLSLEPRHVTWFLSNAMQLLDEQKVGLVRADPHPIGLDSATLPQISPDLYYRLHGSPVMYSSSYDNHFLHNLMTAILKQYPYCKHIWCIFDNTAEGAAFPNAMQFKALCSE
jgi:uncharacterized protein YecE (DUF72 family)